MAPKVGFSVTLHVREVTGVPFSNKSLFVKWKLTSKKQVCGNTGVKLVHDHACAWDDKFSFDVELSVGRDNVAKPCMLHFSVREASDTGTIDSFERLGVAEFDLSAVAHTRESFHRVLLRRTKANTTMNFTLWMLQTSGAPTFRCRPLVGVTQGDTDLPWVPACLRVTGSLISVAGIYHRTR
jgi:hypothetical protein